MVPGHALQHLAQQLLQAAAERDPAHGVQQEVDAEVGVVEEHEELLQAPQQVGRVLACQGEEEDAQSDHVAGKQEFAFSPLMIDVIVNAATHSAAPESALYGGQARCFWFNRVSRGFSAGNRDTPIYCPRKLRAFPTDVVEVRTFWRSLCWIYLRKCGEWWTTGVGCGRF